MTGGPAPEEPGVERTRLWDPLLRSFHWLLAAAVITGFFAERGGWQSAFLVPGVLSLLAGGALALRRLRSGPPPTTESDV